MFFLQLFLLGQPLQTNGAFSVLLHFIFNALNELPFTRILLANTSLEIVVCDFPIFSPICLKGILSFKLLSIIILCDNVICFAIIFSPLLIGKAARAYYTIKRNIIQIDNWKTN